MSNGKYRVEKNCLNCGHTVEEHYCSACGQPNLELKENFWAFIGHSIAHYFHFDNKFFNTVKPLLIKPGKVTLDYLAGKRARYINPVSLYIFVSIVYFIIVASPGKDLQKEKNKAIMEYGVGKADYSTKKAKSEEAEYIDILDELYANNAVNKALIKVSFNQLSDSAQRNYLQALKLRNDTLKSDTLKKNIVYLEKLIQRKAEKNKSANVKAESEDNWFTKLYKKREVLMQKNAEGIDQFVEQNKPKQYFLLMPLLAFFIMINFRKNRIFYLDHLIFTIHTMTAWFIIQTTAYLIETYIFRSHGGLTILVDLLEMSWLFWYLYTGIRVFYQRKRSTTIFRIIVIMLLYAMAMEISEYMMINAGFIMVS